MTLSYENEFDALLEHLKQTLSLEKLEKEDKNICTIMAENLFFTLINQYGNLIFVSNLAHLDKYKNKEKIKDFILDANVLYLGSLSGTFAINEDGFISYCFQYPMSILSNDDFIALLDRFIMNTREFIKKFDEIDSSSLETGISLSEQSMQQNWQKI